jgi:hypothetical protein
VVAIRSGAEEAQGSSGQTGYFYLLNLSTGTYEVSPTLDPIDSVSPSSTSVTITTPGTTVFSSSFTVAAGLAEIQGQVVDASSHTITTGVLILASSATLSGGSTSPPPAFRGATGPSCAPCYYGTSSDSTGRYNLYLRSSATSYKLYAWYTTLDGQTATVHRLGPYTVPVATPGTIAWQDFQW